MCVIRNVVRVIRLLPLGATDPALPITEEIITTSPHSRPTSGSAAELTQRSRISMAYKVYSFQIRYINFKFNLTIKLITEVPKGMNEQLLNSLWGR